VGRGGAGLLMATARLVRRAVALALALVFAGACVEAARPLAEDVRAGRKLSQELSLTDLIMVAIFGVLEGLGGL